LSQTAANHSPLLLGLEQNYYEILDKDNVEVVNINEKNGTPIEKFTEKGIVTDGKEREFDIIVLATGFDVVSVFANLLFMDFANDRG
jgi:cation diffusion facilitator CzcD-associated flavoprotein CzcO